LVPQQELHGINDVAHGRQFATGRPRRVAVEGRCLARPERAVADDAGMDRVDADRCELEREGVHEPHHPAVDRGDGRRARIGGVLRASAEQHDAGGAAGLDAVEECVDRLGVSDELERHEPPGACHIVVAHGVRIPFDRRQHEPIETADSRELLGDGLGLRDVEPDAGRRLAD
jgi:hypothetical protein